MSELTFNATTEHDGAIRRWDLTGPAGVVRFEVAEAAGFVSPSVYLHAKFRDLGDAPNDCPVCGSGWHDTIVSSRARQLHQDWLERHDEQVIRDQLEHWYEAFVAVHREGWVSS